MNEGTSKVNQLSGILPAVVTPFDSDGRLVVKPFEQLLARLYAAGVHGVYLCGSTGEGLTQPIAQRKLVTEAAVSCSPPGKQVIVHVGAMNTVEAIDLARHAAAAGAHAVSSLPPLAGSYSFAEIKAYYQTLAEAAELPLLLYYFPEVSPAIETAEQVLDLCALPNVSGLKFTDYNLSTMLRLKQRGATVFYGRDEMLTAGLLFGADGGIGSFYNLIPTQFMTVWYETLENHHDAALETQKRINEFITITLR
jgi:N-acetylneuraminate lyase